MREYYGNDRKVKKEKILAIATIVIALIMIAISCIIEGDTLVLAIKILSVMLGLLLATKGYYDLKHATGVQKIPYSSNVEEKTICYYSEFESKKSNGGKIVLPIANFNRLEIYKINSSIQLLEFSIAGQKKSKECINVVTLSRTDVDNFLDDIKEINPGIKIANYR